MLILATRDACRPFVNFSRASLRSVWLVAVAPSVRNVKVVINRALKAWRTESHFRMSFRPNIIASQLSEGAGLFRESAISIEGCQLARLFRGKET